MATGVELEALLHVWQTVPSTQPRVVSMPCCWFWWVPVLCHPLPTVPCARHCYLSHTQDCRSGQRASSCRPTTHRQAAAAHSAHAVNVRFAILLIP